MSNHIKSSDCNCHITRAIPLQGRPCDDYESSPDDFHCRHCGFSMVDHKPNYGYEDLVPKPEPRIVNVTPYGYEEEPTVPHYDAKGKIRVWDFIADKELDFFEGNVVKYVCRSPYKGEQVKDLEKAISYLQKKIKLVREQSQP